MSAATFRARYAAYSLDVLMLAPLAALLAWRPLAGAVDAFEALTGAMTVAMERAFQNGDIALFALATALQRDPAFMAAMGEGVASITAQLLVALVMVIAAFALWFVGFEASPWQATPGKRALGLRVTALDGGRPSMSRVALRFVAAAPSWLLLHLGHAMAAWREDGRTLHDLVAGTQVQGPADLPAWAGAFITAQGLAVLAWLVWVAWRLLEAALMLGL